MRHDIAFTSGGLTCRGWFYEPRNPGGAAAPAIVMTHGFAAVKEQGLAEFAEAFSATGFAVLVFDYRHLGASDGAERGRIIAQEQHDDLRAALGFISMRPGVDPNRIGMWGASFSGGHSLFLGALDPRVRTIVAMVPALDNAHSIIATSGRDRLSALLPRLAAEHAMRNQGAPSPRIPIVAPEGQPCVFPTADSYEWFMGSRASAPSWLDTTTAESIARMLEYQPAGFIDLIAPKPLLILANVKDAIVPIEQVRATFARAGEPKKLVEFEGGHYDFFPSGRFHEQAVTEAIDWFRKALS